MSEKLSPKTKEFEEIVAKSSAEELEKLADDEDEEVRQKVALHGNVSDALFRKLARDNSVLVRCAIPVNENVTEEILMMLVDDSEWETRWNVANSNNASIEVLKRLVNDEVEPVRLSAQEHIDYLAQRN